MTISYKGQVVPILIYSDFALSRFTECHIAVTPSEALVYCEEGGRPKNLKMGHQDKFKFGYVT